MKRGLLSAVFALALCLSLTSCGMNAGNAQPGTETDNSSITDNGPGNGGADMNGTNGVGGVNGGDRNDDAVGNADGYTNDNSNTRARMTAKTTPKLGRTAADYLRDGRYTATSDGQVLPKSGDLGSELTQGARDLIRDAKELGKDLANDAGNAVKSGADAARSTGRAAGKTIRDKMS